MSKPTAFIDVQLVSHPVRMIDLPTAPLAPTAPAAPPLHSLPHGPNRIGAECIFVGRTRLDSHPEHGDLKQLSYEAYHEMAEAVLRDLALRAVEDFGCLAVRLHHALGEVPIGEASVLVQVACGHRQKAFEACRFLIDRLKTDAPIWKRERWERGETWSEASSVITTDR